MHDATSRSHAHPPSGGIPSEAETLARQAFQALHPEVGFRFLDGTWLAYWADGGGRQRRARAATLTELLNGLAGEFS